MEQLLQCIKCLGWYGEEFFSTHGPTNLSKSSCLKYRRRRCKLCYLSGRTEEKYGPGRFRVKAQSAIGTHTPKLVRKGLIQSKRELIEKYGWNVAEMAHDIEHAFKNGCPECRELFGTMPNGLADVTLDIVDPKQPPYYGVNTRWFCMTCNRIKGQMSSEQWGAEGRWRREWRKQQERLRRNPMVGTLFE
jgi:hypothetical protein